MPPLPVPGGTSSSDASLKRMAHRAPEIMLSISWRFRCRCSSLVRPLISPIALRELQVLLPVVGRHVVLAGADVIADRIADRLVESRASCPSRSPSFPSSSYTRDAPTRRGTRLEGPTTGPPRRSLHTDRTRRRERDQEMRIERHRVFLVVVLPEVRAEPVREARIEILASLAEIAAR